MLLVMTFLINQKLICAYNKYTGGIDYNDQLLVYFAIGWKPLKWWKHVFWRLVKMLCWSTATCSMKLNLTRISYPEAVQAQFMPFSGSATIYVERKSGCQSCQGAWFLAPVPCDCLIGKHFGQRAGKRKRCKVCVYTKNAKGNLKHTKTNLYCANCDAHLCEQPCFQKWHSQSSLW